MHIIVGIMMERDREWERERDWDRVISNSLTPYSSFSQNGLLILGIYYI